MTHGLYSLLTAITDIGDSSVLGAIVIASSGYLMWCGCRKGAVAMILAFLSAAISIAFVKIAFLGCGDYFRQFDIRSPSGHTTLSVAVFGTYALLISSQLNKNRRAIPIILLTFLIGAIAMTRVLLRFHSAGEVLIGLVAGGIIVAFTRSYLRHGEGIPPFDARALVLSPLIPALILHGTRLPIEDLIQLLALHIKHYANCT